MGAEDEIEPPPRRLLALEARGLLDIPALLVAAPFLASAPRGQRHGVIVVPGLGADDRSTVAIRRLLSHLGYDVHGWNRGRNIRRAEADLPAMIEQISRLRAATGLPVSLVGWSRGGIMAREVAREIAADIRMVITLGSPFAAPTASNVVTLWRVLTGEQTPPNPERMRALARPVPVPATAIYTRSDGVVAWRACLEPDGPQSENIEARTTHLGLGFHAPALWVIADRLAQPFGTWRPFRPGPLVAPFFPRRAAADS
jgi:pimeloyl-ACP methyl ester carboxylesterase